MLNWYVQTIAATFGKQGIRCNAILPGVIETPAMKAWANPAMTAAFLDLQNLPRLGQPEDIAALTTFLASDEAAYINGALMRADGDMNTSICSTWRARVGRTRRACRGWKRRLGVHACSPASGQGYQREGQVVHRQAGKGLRSKAEIAGLGDGAIADGVHVVTEDHGARQHLEAWRIVDRRSFIDIESRVESLEPDAAIGRALGKPAGRKVGMHRDPDQRSGVGAGQCRQHGRGKGSRLARSPVPRALRWAGSRRKHICNEAFPPWACQGRGWAVKAARNRRLLCRCRRRSGAGLGQPA